ncbi:unnamed protein product, partial [Durusdinium trenchii]
MRDPRGVLLRTRGHERRALSRLLRDALDVAWPVLRFGPPPLPARACYRVPIGASRASYGVWVKAHKAVSLETHLSSKRKLPRCPKWDQTVTKSSVGYGNVHEDGLLDATVSCGFWKAVLRLLHSDAVGATAPGPGCLSVCFGGKERRLE